MANSVKFEYRKVTLLRSKIGQDMILFFAVNVPAPYPNVPEDDLVIRVDVARLHGEKWLEEMGISDYEFIEG